MRATAVLPAALAAAALLQAAPAMAQETPLTVDAILSPVIVETVVNREPARLTDVELDAERGGFFSKEWAQQINFGAVLTTYINGRIAMATQLTLGGGGVTKTVSTDSSAAASVASSKPEAAPSIAPQTTTTSQTSTPNTSQTLVATNENNTIAGQSEATPPAQPAASLTDQAAAAGITLNSELASWDGVVVPGSGGGTAVLQSADVDKIAQVILNTANGVNIQQNTNINLDIPGFAQLQQGFISDQLRSNLQNSIGSALGAALRR